MTDELDPRLSAYLDGEASHAERAAVDDLLASSPEARAELDAVREARDAVRALPLLEPTPEVARMLAAGPRTPIGAGARRRARARAVALSAVATVAFWGLVASSSVVTASVAPSVDSAVSAHTSLLDVDVEETEAMPAMDDTDAKMPHDIDSKLRLVHVGYSGETTHAMYTDGAVQVSVFEQRGRVDWGRLPSGEFQDLHGSRAWFGQLRGYEVVVVQRGHRVYTIVAEPSPDAMPANVTSAMPAEDEPRSVLDRVRDASGTVVSLFGLG